MKKWYGLLAASMLCLGVPACGNSSLVAPEAPRFNSGSTIGPDQPTQGSTPVPAGGVSTTADRGGYTFGSGN
jgi:hypothetical protein